MGLAFYKENAVAGGGGNTEKRMGDEIFKKSFVTEEMDVKRS
jgi:hypothetical protein